MAEQKGIARLINEMHKKDRLLEELERENMKNHKCYPCVWASWVNPTKVVCPFISCVGYKGFTKSGP